MLTLGITTDNPFLEEVERRSGQHILHCYQCGKCVGSCPVSPFMDLPPRKIMQQVKLGLKGETISANAMWFCLTCAACSARCPREIDIPRVMEAIRHMAIEEGIQSDNSHVNAIRKFHTIFLEMVRRYGRSYELRLMAEFNIRTWNLFKDVALAPMALIKGKIPLLVKPVKNTRAIRNLFRYARETDNPHENKP